MALNTDQMRLANIIKAALERVDLWPDNPASSPRALKAIGERFANHMLDSTPEDRAQFLINCGMRAEMEAVLTHHTDGTRILHKGAALPLKVNVRTLVGMNDRAARPAPPVVTHYFSQGTQGKSTDPSEFLDWHEAEPQHFPVRKNMQTASGEFLDWYEADSKRRQKPGES